ncbi:DUF4407 domain-containing protein [Flavobacterium sp. U410]
MKNSFIENIRLKLTTLSGEDGYVLKRCSASLKVYFAVIGFFVLLVFVGCFISATTFTYSLFDENSFISTPFGLLWASIITIIYLLLLYTISPPTLPSKYKTNNGEVVVDEKDHTRFFTFSMFLRLGFMILLAVIIAQPLNVYFLSSSIEPSLEKFKQLQKANMIMAIDSLFIEDELRAKIDFEKHARLKLTDKEFIVAKQKASGLNSKLLSDRVFISKAYNLLDSIEKYNFKPLFIQQNIKQDSLIGELILLLNSEIESDINYQTNLALLPIPNLKISDEFNSYRNQLNKIISSKIKNYRNLEQLLSKSNFYIQKIKIVLHENIFSWMITLCVIIIFLLPIRMKFLVRNKKFYVFKREIEKRVVIDFYEDFKFQYSKILENKIQKVNNDIQDRLFVALLKIREINKDKYNEILKEVKQELYPEKISFHEIWQDPPFRTKRILDDAKFSSEKDFINSLYNTTK